MTTDPARETPIDRFAASRGVPRPPGARALRTRQRLLDAAGVLLGERPYHDVTTALVSQRAGLSPAAFYRYFADLGDVVAELAARMEDSVHRIANLVRATDWRPPAAEESAGSVIHALETFWTEHRALYRVTDLLAEEGDARFAAVKARTFVDLTDAFAEVARTRRTRRTVTPSGRVTAAIVVTALIHTTAREVGFAESGIPLDELRAELARLVADALGTRAHRATDAGPR